MSDNTPQVYFIYFYEAASMYFVPANHIACDKKLERVIVLYCMIGVSRVSGQNGDAKEKSLGTSSPSK